MILNDTEHLLTFIRSSEMLPPRQYDDSTAGIDFTFMTVRCWDEDPSGRWTLIVSDVTKKMIPSISSSNHILETSLGGELISWSLRFLGTSQSTTAADVDISG